MFVCSYNSVLNTVRKLIRICQEFLVALQWDENEMINLLYLTINWFVQTRKCAIVLYGFCQLFKVFLQELI